ncbi:hypothetical protein FZW96_07395 [Bacillus sp. BGMRC 2118]|nr:hypothetical protein FZW96_07395 [Bacillus sp. BGMRC 2118]
MKNYLFIGLLLAAMLTACSQDKVETVKEDTPKKEVIETEKNEDSKETEEAPSVPTDTFEHTEYHYRITLDQRLLDDKHFSIEEEGLKTMIYYDDQTLLKKKALIGSIESVTMDEWNDMKDETQNVSYVLYDEKNGRAHLYISNPVDPYESYYEMDQDGFPFPLDEATAIQKAGALFSISLSQSNFMYSSVKVPQEIPGELDSNQVVGIDVSEGFYQDFKQWHETLANSIETGSEDDVRQTIGNLSETAYTKYPEFRQIPFPTEELAHNIVEGINTFHWFHEHYGVPEEVVNLQIEELVYIQKQYLEAIEAQIQELRN